MAHTEVLPPESAGDETCGSSEAAPPDGGVPLPARLAAAKAAEPPPPGARVCSASRASAFAERIVCRTRANLPQSSGDGSADF